MSKSKSGDFEEIDFDTLGSGLGEKDYPIEEVFGSNSNLKPTSAPINETAKSHGFDDIHGAVRYHFFPTWRSQFLDLIAFFVTSGLAVWVSRLIPNWVVIVGELFTTSSTRYNLHLPILVLVPGFFLSKTLIKIYNSVYVIDDSGIEAQVGLVSFNLRQPRLRWEDIRGIEPTQNIWERILNIGTVKVGSAMTQEAEIIMEGIANPKAVQQLVNSERAKRLEEMKQSGNIYRHSIIGGE